MPARQLKTIPGVGSSISPTYFVENKDRYVDANYDFQMDDGRYAYIGVVWDPIGRNRVAVSRTKDINWHTNGIADYVVDFSHFNVAYTNYTANPQTASDLKHDGLAVVLYHRDFAINHKNWKAAPAYGGKGIEIIPLTKFAKDNPDVLWQIYQHHLRQDPGKAESADPGSLGSLLPVDIRTVPPELENIDQRIRDTLRSYADPERPQASKAVSRFSAGQLKELDNEPEFRAVPIPYMPTAAEAEAMWHPGFTRIGYSALMIPPEHINYLREQPVESKQLLRAHGSNKKGYGHSSKEFQIQLHLQDSATINGVLLPIIRQFMKTPFVPVENELLNYTYDVQALTLEAIQIATVPGYPNCLDVTIQAAEFNWRAYMPGEFDLDSTFCYPLYKVWCENIETTDTRPIGWTNKKDYIASLRSDSHHMPVMNGKFTMYLPDEKYLRELEELATVSYNQEVAFTMMQGDAANIELARKFGTTTGRDDVLSSNGAKRTEQMTEPLYCYDHVSVAKEYDGNESQIKFDTAPDGEEFILHNRPAVAIKIKDRQFARKLLLQMADAIETNKRLFEGHPEWVQGAPGYVPTPYTEVPGAKNPFSYGLFVTPGATDPVRHEQVVSRGLHVIKGKVWSAQTIRNFVSSKLENVIAGGPTADGQNVEDVLAGGYFVIPRDQVSRLGYLLDIYADAAKEVESKRTELERRAASVRDLPADVDELLDKGVWLPVEVPSFVVENVAVGSENLIAGLMPQMQDSPVHQFLGRADAHVVVRGTITDQNDVAALTELMDRLEYLTRRYGGVQMANPFEKGPAAGLGGYSGYMLIMNEICRLMGVTHAIPVRCNILTSKDFPGTFDVEVVFAQFNIFQQDQARPKELTDIDWIATPEGPKNSRGESAQKTTDTYYDHILRAQHFHKKLRTMELYPDMKLPTYTKLKNWVDHLANDDENLRREFLITRGIDPDKFAWSSKDCKPLKKVKFPTDLDTGFVMAAYADPDFYSVPSFPTGKEFVEGVLETLSGSVSPKRNAKWTLPGKEVKAEDMNLRDRKKLSGKVTFRGDIMLSEDGELSKVKTAYSAIRFPEYDKSGALTGYKAIAPERIKAEMKKAGFSPEQFAAIDRQSAAAGVPVPIAYEMFNYEKGAQDSRSSTREASFGIGQLQKSAIDQVNIEVASGRIKSPWDNYKFTLADRKDPDKAAFMASAYLRYFYDRIVKKMGPGVDKKKAWAYANICNVQPGLLGRLDRGAGIEAAVNSLPETDVSMGTTNKSRPNPIRARYDDSLTIMNVDPGDLQSADVDDIPAPKLAETPAVDKTAMVAGVSTKVPEYQVVTHADGRANYFLIGTHEGNHDSHGRLFAVNVYSPKITASGGPYGNGYLDFWQKHEGGRLEKRRLYFIHGDLSRHVMGPSTDSLAHLVDPKAPDIHYFIVRPGTSIGKDKKDYKDWVGYMGRQGINYADFQYLSGDPNGETLWLKGGGKSTKSTPNELKGVVCTNIPEKGKYGNEGPTSYPISKMFYNNDENDPYRGRDMFYDMRRHSGFGRLVQAFPSYCVLIVDGGRWLRYWRLYDHLFGMTAVESIEVAKSKKTPTDVATVTFANMYGHLSKQPAESMQGKVFSWSLPNVIGAFQDSIMNTQRQDAEVLTRWRMHAKSLLLKPGARLHLRMGYGANAATLPAVFNGVISEVTPGMDSLEVLALGDGVELEKLLQPNAKNSDGNTVYRSHSLFGAATTPREAILGILAPTNFIELFTVGGYDHNNPHGIEHYGSPTFRFMQKDVAEIGMNIYEPSTAALQNDIASANSTAFGAAVTGLNIVPGYGTIDGHYNNFLFGISMEDASAWEVFTTCRRAVPEYICSVHPFGLRSTLFFGKAHWPLRFDYADAAVGYHNANGETSFIVSAGRRKDDNGNETGYLNLDGYSSDNPIDLDAVTMWKPYSQMRIITSSHNLISNQIKASDEDVYTICRAVGSHNGLFTQDEQNNDWSDTVFLDTDIYPEHQKTLYVKSGLYSSGTMKFLDAIRDVNTADLLFTRKAGNTYAINAMRDSVMDMYRGQAVIIGDPSIKPHDISFFADTRSEMSGMFRVKEVTHHLSFSTGLVTTVTPDLLASMTDTSEQLAWSWMHQFGHRFAGALGLQHMIGTVAAKKANPLPVIEKLSRRLTNYTGKNAPWVNEALEKLNELTAQTAEAAAKGLDDISESLLTNPKVSENMDKFFKEFDETLREIFKLVEDAERKGFVARRITNPLLKKIQTTRDLWKVEYDAAKIGKAVAHALSTRNVQGLRDALAIARETDIVRILGKRGVTASRAAKLGKLSIYMLAVDSIFEWVNRKLAYRQCLILRPLVLNNREFSAGINGHLGCVVGDPDGYWDGVIQSLTNWNYNQSHKKGTYYGYNGDASKTEAFGTTALGVISIFAAAAGVEPVDYGNKSADDIDTHIFGEGSMSEAERDLHYKHIQDHMHRIYNGDIDAANGFDATPTGVPQDMQNYYSGRGYKATLEETRSGDYGPNHCNRYAYDVMIANGWVAPKRTPGKNTGEAGSIAVNSLPGHQNLYTQLLEGPDARNKANLKPGMLVRLEPQHWAVITEDMTLNENLNGKVQNTRTVDSVLGRIKWAMMPKYS